MHLSNGTRGKDQPVNNCVVSGRAVGFQMTPPPKPTTKYVVFETVEEQLAFALDVLGQVPLNVVNADVRARKYATLIVADNLLGVNARLEHVRQDAERK